jgi:ceroid-lipofuscinosis MFS transporter 7
VSVFSIGQLIGSPLFGYWANKLRYHKLPLIATMLLTIFGNLLYLYLESTKNVEFASPKIWMLVSRFIIGVGASGAAVIRSYVSSATSVEERTAALANISASQGLGFIM